MTNSDLLKANPKHLNGLDRQRRCVLLRHNQQKPCPNCGEPHSVFEAIGIPIDDYTFSAEVSDNGKCRSCGRSLIFVLPLMGGWHWRLDYAEAKKGNQP